MLILAGDVGGTKTHLALYDGKECLRDEKYLSREYRNLSDIIKRFLPDKIKVARACFGVAGPVHEGISRTTNLPWTIESQKIAQELSIEKVWLINDLVATAWGIRCLKPDEIATLNVGKSRKGNRALIAAGTGLGEAGMIWEGASHLPFASEGGHADFAPRDDKEKELWKYLKKKYGHVSKERVVSGPGLEHLYWFLIESGRSHDRVQGDVLPKVIVEKGISGESRTCREALDWFVSLYASAAGDLALTFLAYGGVYLGGGIAPRIISLLQSESFMKSFRNKGRMDATLDEIPVRVILNDNAALLGAAEFANLQE